MPQDSQIDDFEELKEKSDFNFESFLNANKIPIAGALIGLILVGIGVFMFKQGYFASTDKIEVVTSESLDQKEKRKIIVEISGAIEKPGVYKLDEESRVEDLLIASGGLSVNADRVWVEKYINRASKLADGQKLYIMREGETDIKQSNASAAKNSGGIKVDQGVVEGIKSGGININTATLSELDSLPGIGQVYGQSIIDHRPYSSIEELLGSGAVKQSVYEKIKNLVTIY